MDDMSLRVNARPSSGHEVVLMVVGYLDEEGGQRLARETRAAPSEETCRICIDLNDVCLFNCFGARLLVTLIDDLDKRGCEVDLVGVRPPLQRFLDLST
jgi:anti-anti-sigma factor